MRRNIVLLVIALNGACADPSPSIPEPEGPSKVPSTTQLPPPSNGGERSRSGAASTFSISEWKKIDATKKEVDFDVVANVEDSITLLEHESDAVIEADRDVAIDPVTGGKPEGSIRGIAAVSGQRLLLRADWGDRLVVVVPLIGGLS